MPLLMLLHGCDQQAEEFVDGTRFTSVADRHGIVLVAPEQTFHHHPNRCWRWYEARNQERGRGEPAALAGLATAMVEDRTRWRIDPRRVYVAGLSAGGAMALVLAVTYPDLFAGVGLHSAPPYRSAAGAAGAFAAMTARVPAPRPVPGMSPLPPAVIVQGMADRVVAPENGTRVAAQWLAFQGAGPLRSTTGSGRSGDGRGYRSVRWFARRGRAVLQLWLVDDLGHAWSGGRPGASYSDPVGPRAATLMWRFLRRQRLVRRGARPLPVAGA